MTEQSTGSTQPDALANTLSERGSRYGAFKGHAEVSQELKKVVWRALAIRNKGLDPDQLEALEMIMHKIGRIINGDANYDDSWRDIAGYAMLVCDRLNGIVR
jgi:Holliday junction resolvasome RuvABC ATP-dependent DNA helicase subunit